MRYAAPLIALSLFPASVALADPTNPAQTPSDISHGDDVGPAAIRDKTSETRVGAAGYTTSGGGGGVSFRAGNTGGVNLAPDRNDSHENGPALTFDVDARMDVGRTEKDGESGVQRMELQFSPFTAYRFRGINRYASETELRLKYSELRDRIPDIHALYEQQAALKKAVEDADAEYKRNACYDTYYSSMKSDCTDEAGKQKAARDRDELTRRQSALDMHNGRMREKELPEDPEGLFRHLPSATGDISVARLSYEHRTDEALAIHRNAGVIEGVVASGHIATRIGSANIDFCGKLSPAAIALGQNGVGDRSPELMYRLRASGCVGTQLGEIAHLRGQVDFGLDASSVSGSRTVVNGEGDEEQKSYTKGILATELALTGAVDNIAGTGVGVYYQHTRGHSSDGTKSRDVKGHYVGVSAAF